VLPEADVAELTPFLDSLKWDSNGLVVAIAQHVDTGEVLMQAFADRAAVSETLQTGYAFRLYCCELPASWNAS
jgi:phosphoribosyl-ATP pyrophosphohydrolase/phosphoribosyl-AMP cyclohydrolase